MKIYIVTYITDAEYCGAVNVAVFDNETDAEAYVDERQETFEHWSGRPIERYSIEEWEIS